MRMLRMMAHVGQRDVLGMPPLRRGVGELSGIEPQGHRQGARLRFVGHVASASPVVDVARLEAGGAG